MKFISVELSGYLRIALNGTKYIKLTPVQDVQLILGTNGSGKSSLLDEITPLPSNSSDYSKDGFSIKTISHNGSIYILKSTFNPTQKHSFLKDDVELNQGGTVTVQKELVRQEFGITPEIHELIMGRDKFTKMPPSRRRYWFTQLSSVSYDYAIGVFNKIKERHRDTLGALKLNRSRLVTESAKLLPKEEQEQIKSEISELHEFLLESSNYRVPVDKSKNDIEIQIKEIFIDTETLAKQVKKKSLSIKKSSLNYLGLDIDSFISELNSRISFLTLMLDQLTTRHSKVVSNLLVLARTGNQGIDEFENQIKNLQDEQLSTQVNKRILTESVFKSPIEALRAIEIINDSLCTIFTEIPSNGDLKYSTASKNNLLFEKGKIIDRVEVLKKEIVRLSTKRTHLEEHKKNSNLVCPNCSKPFSFSFSQNEYDQVLNILNSHEDELSKLDNKKQEIENDLQELENYFLIYKKFTTISESYPVLKDLWFIIKNEILSNPNGCSLILNNFKSDLYLDKKYLDLDTEIEELKKLIVAKKLIGDQDTNKLKKEMEDIEHETYGYQKELIDSKTKLNKATEHKKDLEQINKMQILLTDNEKQINGLVDSLIETNRRITIIEGIKSVQSVLSRKESILFDVINQEKIIANLEETIKLLEIDEKCLKIIISELSPTDGLIAEGLFGFIKLFISQMNNFIGKIWTYEMNIQSCDLSDTSKVELDYKFPIQIEGREKPVADVSLASTGMMEIIDLAFKIIAIKNLGLSDTPLFLDEFGAALDHTHRTMIYSVFDYLVNQINFSQVFIVNHYSHLYGSMKNADVCILHDTNVEIPNGTIYNKHVTIA
jgi:energy-coupling factor transporter ATP-binding protein EcfA2